MASSLSDGIVSTSFAVLEIGFGNGAFAGWLHQKHPQITWTGIERQLSLVEKAKKSGFYAMPELSGQVIPHQFDLIVAFDVLEHLSDQEITEFFAKALVLVKPHGLCLARVPNAGGPFGLPNQTGDPTHITPISISRLESYLDQWDIAETGDIQPIWEGKVLSAFRNALRLTVRAFISTLIRFAFAPQPKTLLASNLHITLRPKK